MLRPILEGVQIGLMLIAMAVTGIIGAAIGIGVYQTTKYMVLKTFF